MSEEKVQPLTGKEKFVYYFGEGSILDKSVLGGKGAGLHEMVRMKLPIPTGFTISTITCNEYTRIGAWPTNLHDQVYKAVAQMEKTTGKKFGDPSNPLLLSVRSGAKFSMPGMMDTVLNLGLTPDIVAGLATKTGDARFAKDSYRRFIQMYGDIVCGVEHMKFEGEIEKVKKATGVKFDIDLTVDHLDTLIKNYLTMFTKETGKTFPTDPREQLDEAINAVFSSWNNKRAITYRNMNNIPHDLGTGVNVQEMVYGNLGMTSATGVAFTRNPSTGEKGYYGEYLKNAQGEDVVAGIRTPLDISELEKEFKKNYDELIELFHILENHMLDMQDVEFTIEQGKLYMLQCRNGKRTAPAAVRMAVEMVKEGLITKEQAVLRVEPEQLDLLLHPQFDVKLLKTMTPIAKGLPASPGAAVGQIFFNADDAVAAHNDGIKVILVRLETSPEDIHGMAISQGILTARGGMTSHAAVVARGANITCVAGCSECVIEDKTLHIGSKVFQEKDWISLDGSTGAIYNGQIPVSAPSLSGEFGEFMLLAKEYQKLDVLTNADDRKDAVAAKNFGAVGIGLARTEHMFFDPDRIIHVREMICAPDEAARRVALDKLLKFQKANFKDILDVMDTQPVVIRLLDPPLHEFLPHAHPEQVKVAEELKMEVDTLIQKVDSLHEFNPMLGFRGCRLGVIYPEINEMQVKAIFLASLELLKEKKHPNPWIEIPLVGKLEEFLPLKALIKRVAEETGAEGVVDYKIGTMIEVPRAALTADEIAPHAEFLSFGTNDLTQMTCGFSRDDAGAFLKNYVKMGIYKRDPFQSIDQDGVGKLMKICVDLAKKANPAIDIGICGEHGGEPNSVTFCHTIGLNSVSCSPYRVPIARLAAAQANLVDKGFTSH